MPSDNKPTYKQTGTPAITRAWGIKHIPTYTHHLIQPLRILYIYFNKETTGGKLKQLQKILLVLLLITLPWNLGKHWENNQSIVSSSHIPYLIPTLYIQDILVLFITLLSFTKSGTRTRPSGFRNVIRILFLFIVSAYLSIFFSERSLPSIYFFSRILLYVLFVFTTSHLFMDRPLRRTILFVISINLVLVSILGVIQFHKQASFFNNYLFFGEQPYRSNTLLIAKENYGGSLLIPPYSTFMHPNVLAGYLVISLIVVIYALKMNLLRKELLLTGLLLGMSVLFLTKSYTAWVALLVGVVLLFRTRLFPVMLTGVVILLLGLLFPVYGSFAGTFLPANSTLSTLSVTRRSDLLLTSFELFLQKPLFGWGINSFTYSSQAFRPTTLELSFIQPVHNVFALLAAEIGIFGLLLALAAGFYALYLSVFRGSALYPALFLVILLLASFDHYFLTAVQMQLLVILTLMLSLTYTKDASCL